MPYVGFSPTGLVWLETSTDSRYISLRANMTWCKAKGLRLLSSYTLAKALDYNPAPGATFGDFRRNILRGPAQHNGQSPCV